MSIYKSLKEIDLDNNICYRIDFMRHSIYVYSCRGGCAIIIKYPYAMLTMNCDVKTGSVFLERIVSIVYNIDLLYDIISVLYIEHREIDWMYGGTVYDER